MGRYDLDHGPERGKSGGYSMFLRLLVGIGVKSRVVVEKKNE